MFWLGLPVHDHEELTLQCASSLAETIVDPEQLTLVVIDNDSTKPLEPSPIYAAIKAAMQSRTMVYRFSPQLGYYQAIPFLASMATSADMIGVIHNDLIVYENGWDRRLRKAFLEDPLLAAVGFCGSYELDKYGGRGGGTMCHFRGDKGQAQTVGERIHGIRPAIVFDSLFMAFRASVAGLLGIDKHTPLGHFVDKLIPLKLNVAGFHVGVLGVEVDHISGQTSGGPYWEAECQRWCEQEGVPKNPIHEWGTTLYLESERRFLDYARSKGMLPSHMVGWKATPWR